MKIGINETIEPERKKYYESDSVNLLSVGNG